MNRTLKRFAFAAVVAVSALAAFAADDKASQVKPAVTLHVILQSHLDPVWLWNREQGVDAAIATARTMCDILDDYPETHMTRGEAWIYECCEKYDPETFRRLKAHVAGGRLHVVGGEYVQPDCNLPAADAFADHLSFARRYFRERVGVSRIETGYNPDSFGHGAYLPRFLSDAGMRNYLFMRPGAHEKRLPGEVFRWRSPDGAEVLAARIDGCYNPSSADDAMYWQVTNAVACCDRRIGHCFTMIGVGDHGGGPARAQVDWLLKHRSEWPDVKVVFSHPDAFFAAVRASGVELPVVTGELQHHAIGCYSALSRIKREVRETEDALRRDGELLSADVRDDCRAKLYFATFHDILGGCSIASAYPDIYDSLGYVRSVCRDARLAQTRCRNAKLPPAKCQRVIFDNPGKGRWRGVTEFEAWLKSNEGWYSWTEALNEKLCLRDADGHVVPIQFVPHRDKSGRPQPNLAISLDLAPGETRTYSLCYDKTEAEAAIEDCKPLSAEETPLFRFEVIEDKTDTWSHGVNGYPAATRTLARTGEKRLLTTGCILAETLEEYADPSGRAFVRVRQERGLPGVRFKTRVVWSQPREIVKLAIEPGFAVASRIDRVSGGNVVRTLDGEEWPFAGAVTLLGVNGRRFSVICRDVTALDVQKDGMVRLTLFRTPPYSEHVPAKVSDVSCPVTDLGEHFFDIQVLREASDEQIEDALYALASPLVFSETTKGVGK